MNRGRVFVVVAAVLACGLATSQGTGKQDPVERRFEVLEQDLVSTRERAEGLALELSDTQAALAATIKFLSEQSKSAQSMAETLDASEKAGFTAGINYESRHILLRGWREQLATAQKDLPALPEVKKADAKKPAAPAVTK